MLQTSFNDMKTSDLQVMCLSDLLMLLILGTVVVEKTSDDGVQTKFSHRNSNSSMYKTPQEH